MVTSLDGAGVLADFLAAICGHYQVRRQVSGGSA